VIPLAAGTQYRLWVLFGDYASREEAAAASSRLPPRYRQAFRAAPRSFGDLRNQL
jgi:septal ring-binding cell division protein DamX